MQVRIRVIIAGFLLFSALGLLIFALPLWLVTEFTSHAAKSRWQEVASLRAMFVQLLGGLALLTGVYFAGQTFRLSRRSHQNERFAQAIENLGNQDSEAVRAGGAFILYALATEQDYFWPLLEEVLAVVVRERMQSRETGKAYSDVQAALTVLGRRPQRPGGKKGSPIRLRGLDLSEFELSRANLDRVDFEGTVLQGADLIGAKLTRAKLRGCNFDAADLSGAILTEADCRGATFTGTNLFQTNLRNVQAESAQFARAINTEPDQFGQLRGTPHSLP